MCTKKAMFATLACLLVWTVAAAAAPTHEQALTVGKKGEITLTQPTKVGDRLLQPDTYVVQHRTSRSGQHFVRFLELKQYKGFLSEPGPYTYTEQENAGEIPCKVEPAPAPIKETKVYIVTENGAPRITKVEIKGENVVHVL